MFSAVQKYMFLVAMWVLRNVLDSNYGKEKTKYNIDTFAGYELAKKVYDNAMLHLQTDMLQLPGFELNSFADTVHLGHEINRFERLNNIKWYTHTDQMSIHSMEEYNMVEVGWTWWCEFREAFRFQFCKPEPIDADFINTVFKDVL